jgi:hypothetical protein
MEKKRKNGRGCILTDLHRNFPRAAQSKICWLEDLSTWIADNALELVVDTILVCECIVAAESTGSSEMRMTNKR